MITAQRTERWVHRVAGLLLLCYFAAWLFLFVYVLMRFA